MNKRTILLIEDERAISEPLTAALAREGFDPVLAETAEAGMELFARREPDLVLLDVMLPDGDGRDLLRRIRETSRTPVVCSPPAARRWTACSASSWAPTTT